MCGIMAYVGGQNALPLVLDGLRRLEYRGYDSAGIAGLLDGDAGINGHRTERTAGWGRSSGLAPTVVPATVVVRRAPGKLDRLVATVAAESGPGDGALRGRVAIGHTRW